MPIYHCNISQPKTPAAGRQEYLERQGKQAYREGNGCPVNPMRSREKTSYHKSMLEQHPSLLKETDTN